MAQTEEIERFAARMRGLKNRSGYSFEELAKRTGVSGSSLHRYCSGTKFPSGYGVVRVFAKACGVSGEELKELHELWVLADASRSPASDSSASSGTPSAPADVEERTEVAGDPSVTPVRRLPRLRRIGRGLLVTAFIASLAMNIVTVVAVLSTRHSHASAAKTAVHGATAPVRVFNIEGDCKTRKDRIPACSLGLARNPRLKYDAGNVVDHRVWHNDVLQADCVLYDGDLVKDETGDETTRWFRVRLSDVPGGVAWLPAVRTHDNPKLPTCFS